MPFAKALETMARGRRSRTARIAATVDARRGDDMASGLAALPRWFTPLDSAIVEAGERSGKPAEAMTLLAEYYSNLHAARGRVLRLSAYPVVVYHLAALLLGIPLAIFAGDSSVFFITAGWMLGGFYAVLFGCRWLALLAKRLASRSPGADRLLQRLPLAGGLLATWSAAQFATTLAMQVRAGIGVLSGLKAAAAASQSAAMAAAAGKITAEVKAGGALGAAIIASGAFPETLEDAFLTGEQAGKLDQELSRAATLLRQQLFSQIELLAEWSPRILYAGVVIVVATMIINTYMKYLETLGGLFDW